METNTKDPQDLNALFRNGDLNLPEPLYFDPYITDIVEAEEYARKAASFLVEQYAYDDLKLLHSIDDPRIIPYGDFTINADNNDSTTLLYLQSLLNNQQSATDLTSGGIEGYPYSGEQGTLGYSLLESMGYELIFKERAVRLSRSDEADANEVLDSIDNDTDEVYIETGLKRVEVHANATGRDYRNLLFALAFTAVGIILQDENIEQSGSNFHIFLKRRDYFPISKLMLLIADQVIHPPVYEALRGLGTQRKVRLSDQNRNPWQ